MHNSTPSYSDVASEDDQWTPELIFSMKDTGSSPSDIAFALDINLCTVRRYLRMRANGEDYMNRFINGNRVKRWVS